MENLIKCHEEVLYSLQPMIPPQRFDIPSPPDWGMLRKPRCVQIFLQKINKAQEESMKSRYLVHKIVAQCVWVCIFIKLHVTAQSGPVIVVILCHSH